MSITQNVFEEKKPELLEIAKVIQRKAEQFKLLKLATPKETNGKTIEIPILKELTTQEGENLELVLGEDGTRSYLQDSVKTEMAKFYNTWVRVYDKENIDAELDLLYRAAEEIPVKLNKQMEKELLEKVYANMTIENTYTLADSAWSFEGYVLAQNLLLDDEGATFFYVHPNVYAKVLTDTQYAKNFDSQLGDANQLMGDIIVSYKGVKKTDTEYQNFLIKKDVLFRFYPKDITLAVDRIEKKSCSDIVGSYYGGVAVGDTRNLAFYCTAVK